MCIWSKLAYFQAETIFIPKPVSGIPSMMDADWLLASETGSKDIVAIYKLPITEHICHGLLKITNTSINTVCSVCPHLFKCCLKVDKKFNERRVLEIPDGIVVNNKSVLDEIKSGLRIPYLALFTNISERLSRIDNCVPEIATLLDMHSATFDRNVLLKNIDTLIQFTQSKRVNSHSIKTLEYFGGKKGLERLCSIKRILESNQN